MNVYLWKVDGIVKYHTDLEAAAEIDNLTTKPNKTVSEEDWYAAGGLARIIDGKIFLGKTDKELEHDELAIEEQHLQKELNSKDYKVVKASEQGLVLSEIDPELHERREWCRNRINEIREIIEG